MPGELESSCAPHTRDKLGARRLSWRRFGLVIALVLSGGLSGCGLELIPILPLLLRSSQVKHVPPERAPSGSPGRTKQEPRLISLADAPSRMADQAPPSRNRNATRGQVTRGAHLIAPTAAAAAADEARTHELAPRECDCVGLTCRQLIESCGQLWAPYYDRAGPFPSEPDKKRFGPPTRLWR